MNSQLRNVVLAVLFLLCMSVNTGASSVAGQGVFEQPVSMEFHDSELGTVLKKLSDDSGIQIIYDKKLSKKLVSGMYKNEPFKGVIQRLLSGENYSLTMDERKKTLLVEGFGEAHYVTTYTANGDTVLTDVGLSASELRRVYDQQYADFVKELGDKGAFLEEFGMTRGEHEAMYEKQLADFQREQNDDTTMLSEFGITVGEQRAQYAEQVAAFEKQQQNDATVLPEFGMTVGEQRALYAEQVAAFEKQLSDDSEYLPEMGMTRGEHKRMFAQQVSEFQKSLTK